MGLYTEALFKSKLSKLENTMDSIQSTSQWILFHKKHAAATARTWATMLVETAAAEQKLTLIYLANDVVQKAKRKSPELVLEFGKVLSGSVTNFYREVTSARLQAKVDRVLGIWEDRGVYQPDFIARLRANALAAKAQSGGGAEAVSVAAAPAPATTATATGDAASAPGTPMSSGRANALVLRDYPWVKQLVEADELRESVATTAVQMTEFKVPEICAGHAASRLKAKELYTAFLGMVDSEREIRHTIVEALVKVVATQSERIVALNEIANDAQAAIDAFDRVDGGGQVVDPRIARRGKRKAVEMEAGDAGDAPAGAGSNAGAIAAGGAPVPAAKVQHTLGTVDVSWQSPQQYHT